jgi:hypothetical protein
MAEPAAEKVRSAAKAKNKSQLEALGREHFFGERYCFTEFVEMTSKTDLFRKL